MADRIGRISGSMNAELSDRSTARHGEGSSSRQSAHVPRTAADNLNTRLQGSSSMPPRTAMSSEVARLEKLGPPLSKEQLLPGDILLLLDEPENTTWKHKVIGGAQSVANIFSPNSGDPKLVHAVLWTKNQKNQGITDNQPDSRPGEPEIAEASGGFKRVQNTALRKGTYKVYRPKDQNLGDWAAQVAMGWGEKRDIPYGAALSNKSLFRKAFYGEKAQKLAANYRENAFDSKPTSGGMFCSQLIVASYQAASGHTDAPVQGGFRLDAKAATPRMLEHALKMDTDRFEYAGHISISKKDILFKETQ